MDLTISEYDVNWGWWKVCPPIYRSTTECCEKGLSVACHVFYKWINFGIRVCYLTLAFINGESINLVSYLGSSSTATLLLQLSLFLLVFICLVWNYTHIASHDLYMSKRFFIPLLKTQTKSKHELTPYYYYSSQAKGSIFFELTSTPSPLPPLFTSYYSSVTILHPPRPPIFTFTLPIWPSVLYLICLQS